MTAEISHGRVIIKCGIARNPSDSMAFSDGEVYQGPNEETINDALVINRLICQMGLYSEPIVRQTAARIKQLIETVEKVDNIAEIGLELNPASLLNGDFQEEKEAR